MIKYIEADGWRLNYDMKNGKLIDLAREHLHIDGPVCVEPKCPDTYDVEKDWMWQCSECKEPMPDSMDGFIRMLKWHNEEIR